MVNGAWLIVSSLFVVYCSLFIVHYSLFKLPTMRYVRVLFVIVAVLTKSFIAKSQTADELIEKHIEAIGGKDAWRKVNTLRIDGNLNMQGTDIKISLVQLHGKGVRQDLTVQGMDGYQIITPGKGWTFMPFQGQTEVTPMSEEDLKHSQNELDTHGSLLDYKEKGHTAELAGKEVIDGVDCYKISLTLKSGEKEAVFIDPKHYYVIRTTTIQTVSGQDRELQTNYREFEKLAEGIVLAKSLELPYGTMTLEKIEVNTPVDESIFSPAYTPEATQGSRDNK
jgi:hypothetical protein